jgi:hypothetical protein
MSHASLTGAAAMPATLHFAPGNYRFLPGTAFSAGVAPDIGFALRRARFARPVPMGVGFTAIKQHLADQGRPLTALAGCELRSPKPMTPDEFNSFNAGYLETLHGWGCRDGALNPPARSNLAPAIDPPAQAAFFAFTYTVPEAGAAGDFLLSGLPEIRDDAKGMDRIVSGDDASPAGLAAKMQFILDVLRRRVADLGGDWAGITAAQIYSVHDISTLMKGVLSTSGLVEIGPAWHLAWPPVRGFHLEADARRVRTEWVI